MLADAKHTFLYYLPLGGHGKFAKGGDQVEADQIALAVDDTEGVPLPLAIYRSVYIEFAGIAASAAAVVIYVVGAPDFTWADYRVASSRTS